MLHKTLLTIGAVAAAALLAVASSQAGTLISTLNNLTLPRQASLPGVVLEPGAYTFEVMPGHVNLIRVSLKKSGRPVYLGFTNLVARPAGMPPTSVLSFGETSAGRPIPITAWFPVRSSTGYQFRP